MPWVEDEANGLHYERDRKRPEGPRRPTLDELRAANGTCPGHFVRVCTCGGERPCDYEEDDDLNTADDAPADDTGGGAGDGPPAGDAVVEAERAVRDEVPSDPNHHTLRRRRRGKPQGAPRQAS